MTGYMAQDRSRFHTMATTASSIPTSADPNAPIKQAALTGSEKNVLRSRPGRPACCQNKVMNTKKPNATHTDHHPSAERGNPKNRRA